MSLPTTGSPAPGFTLEDNNGAEVSLSDFKGRKMYWCISTLRR